MAPKAKGGARSKSPKKGQKKRKDPEEDAKAQEPEEPKEWYHGPRPDQELLRVVSEQALDMKYTGRTANIEEMYDLLWEGGKNGVPVEDVNQRNYHGFTPIAVAAAAGDAGLVALLLERGADPTIATVGKSEMPMHFAVRYGHILVVQLLLEKVVTGGLLDAPNQEGFNSVQMACVAGNLDILKFLLNAKADPSSRNELRGGVTPLHAAVAEGNFALAEMLLEYGATPHAGDQLGRGPIFMAAQRCDIDGVSLMLRWKADAGQPDPGGTRAIDLVPWDHENKDKVRNMLSAYERCSQWSMDAADAGIPTRRRRDARFDQRGGDNPEELI